jgi:hypothetical protein
MIWPLQRLTGEPPMDIISRAEWGAGYDNGFRPAPLPAQEVWLHHSVTVAPDLVPPFDDDHAAIRTLERIGEQRFGRGISYTFPITPAGLIFEGHSVDRVGAHTGGRNTVSRAICFVGDYERNRPTEAMLDAAAWLLREGRARGWWTAARLTGGHRDAPGASTACPGRHAYALISEINRRAASGGPVPPPPPPKGFEDLMAEIRIHLNSDGTFRGTAKAEAGGGSAVGGDSYVALGSTWGYTDFTTTALGPDGTVLFQWPNVRVHNNLHWAQKLPNGTRTVTVEGRVEHDPSANPSPTIPAAAVWTKPL